MAIRSIRLFIVLLFLTQCNAQAFDKINTAHTCSYFGEKVPDTVTTFASDHEAEKVIADIVSASGLSQNFQIRAAGVPNAAAVVQHGERYVLYNQFFMQETRTATNNDWAPISIMAHEVGHHLNGHTLDGKGSRPDIELEADYYSGFILQQLGASLEDARSAMQLIGSNTGSSTHPAKHDRLAAIGSGWMKACDDDARCNMNPNPSRDQRSEEEVAICEYTNDGECDEPDVCPSGTDTNDCRAGNHRNPDISRNQTQTPPQSSLFCCDQFGRKWCQIQFNPGPPGTPCVCQGVPGSGWMCY